MDTSFTDAQIDLNCGSAVPARVIGTAGRTAPLVLHLHGGAFGCGTASRGECVARMLAEAGAVVISPDYPAGPEHPFPEALELMYRVLESIDRSRARWARKTSKLFLAGEESGGNLAAALAMVARDRRAPKLAGQILLSPMLDASMATCSIRTAEAGPVGCKWADGWHDYLGAPQHAAHPYAAPASASRLAGLAPALVLTGEDDPMRDESLAYARRLRDSGVAARDHTVLGTTRWPDGLACAAGDWRGEVRAIVADFFSTTTQPAPQAHG